MSTPIDEAIGEVMEPLREGWFLQSVEATVVQATTFNDHIEGHDIHLAGEYRATLRHQNGLVATGTGHSAGMAIASAVSLTTSIAQAIAE